MSDDFDDLSAFDQAKANARREYAGFSLQALSGLQAALMAEKEEVEAELKLINAKFDVLRFELIPEKMEEEGIERVSFDEIGRVSLTADLFVSVRDKPSLYNWLEENGFGDLIQPVVNASTLKAFIKGRMKAGEEIPEDCLNVTPVTRASITRPR